MLTLPEPTVVQVTPSVDRLAVKLLPVRTRRSQYGAAGPATKVPLVLPPFCVRRRKTMPLLGEITTEASLALALSEARTMTPALAQPSVFWTLATRATIEPSPVSGM